MISKDNITGIILAGGRGSRLGFDKGLLLDNGITLIGRAINVLSGHCNKLIISSNNLEYNKFGIERVPDILEKNGPMMGIYSSLIASTTKHNLVLAVDNIFVDAAFYEYVLSKLDGSIVALPFIDKQYFEPLVGYYSKEILPDMKRMVYQNNLKLPDLLEIIQVLKLNVQDDYPAYFDDYFRSINLPEDLLILRNSS